MKMHYGMPGLRTACGHFLHNVSIDRSRVSCAACRSTVKFDTEFFTCDAVTNDIPIVSQLTKHRTEPRP